MMNVYGGFGGNVMINRALSEKKTVVREMAFQELYKR